MQAGNHLSGSTKWLREWSLTLHPLKEWMKRVCPCFSQSRIALTESAREKVSLSQLGKLSTRFFFVSSKRMTFTLHDLTDFYVDRVTAHHIKINDYSCFHNRWPNSKTKLKHVWEQGCFGGPTQPILHIGRIGSESSLLTPLRGAARERHYYEAKLISI